MSGTLYLVATPIGNLEDMTFRALRVLSEVDLVAAEDTRTARKLLSHYDIKAKIVSYFEHSGPSKIEYILSTLESGDVALVSEAGMPAISDPGYELVRSAWESGFRVVPVPGASAVIAAVAASGLPTDRFCYFGFLPRKKGDRKALLSEVAAERATMVFFESPHRLLETLGLLVEHLGRRRLVIARELTKLHEEFWRGDTVVALEQWRHREIKGEFTLVVEGVGDGMPPDVEKALTLVKALVEEGVPRPEALRAVARVTGLSKRTLYRRAMDDEF